ncbi:MAG: hypothetical protein U5P10_10565 [Spirochaetia bacterium]|nr:hypothetical protein [Spirochaetia bacterium]
MNKQNFNFGRRTYARPAAVLIMFLLLSVVSCYVEPRAGATVTPHLSFTTASRGFGDVLGSIKLDITGPGIDQQWFFSEEEDSIVISLPEADNVRFEVEAQLDTLGGTYTGPVLSYGGVLYADLVAGKSINLNFNMGPYETKILVPDYSLSKLIQLKNMSISENNPVSPDWEESDLSFFELGAPWDIEIDNLGQIWIASDNSLSAIYEVPITYDESELPELLNIYTTPIYSLAFDRQNNYLYYILDEGNSFYSINRITTDFDILDVAITDITEISSTVVSATNTIYPFGLAVDDEGFIYFTVNVGSTTPQWNLYKIHPDSPDTIEASTTEITTNPDASPYDYPDLLYKEGHIYVTNRAGPDGEQILKLNKDLVLVGSFGVAATELGTTVEGEFFGPSRFLASTNKKIYVIDEAIDAPIGDITSNETI